MNSAEPKPRSGSVLVRLRAKCSEHFRARFRPRCHSARGQIVPPAARMAESLGLSKKCFGPPQLRFCVFALVNIDKQVIPADHASVRVPRRKRPQLEPAIDAVRTAKSEVKLEGTAGFRRAHPRV